MEEKTFGIENLKKVLAVPFELGNIAGSIIEDQAKGWKAYLKLVDIADEVFDLFKVEWTALKDEYLDLSDAEREEIKAYFVEKFDIPQDEIEAKIETAFEVIFELEAIGKKIYGLVKTIIGK